MKKISDMLSNSRDKEIADRLERDIARARWCGSSVCVIDADDARYLLAMLVGKEKSDERSL